MTIPTSSQQEITNALSTLLEPGQVTELRVLDAVTGNYRQPHVESGYFDDHAALARCVAEVQQAKGFYIIPNVVDPSLLSRATNRLRPAKRGEQTGDGDILKRRLLMIDIDSVRPSGISATKQEHEAAHRRARDVYAWLRRQGWPAPVVADSGNGYHLLFRIDCPAEDGGLVQRFLETLASRFDDEAAKIDRSVHNPARIWKLYGTVACKGDPSPERPHRLAQIVSKPDVLQIVPLDQLNAVAEAGATAPTRRADTKPNRTGSFDLKRWLATHDLNVTGPLEWQCKDGQSGEKWIFHICPYHSEHDNESAYIIQFANGAVAAGCHHDSCDWGWSDLRRKVEGNGCPPGLPLVGGDADTIDAEDESASQADQLVKLAEAAQLFHAPGGGDNDVYATVLDDGHAKTWPIHRKGFKRWLVRRFYELHHKVLRSQVVQDALAVIAGKALYEGPTIPVAVRLTEHNGAIYLDLADEAWRVVRITPAGWEVIPNPPVKFIRRSGLMPLPAPIQGGSVDELRSLINLDDDESWTLFVAWLVATLRPNGPYPILAVNGEHGSAKSTLCRMARALVDPNKSPLRSKPKDERDLMIAAGNSWIVAYDNLSGVPNELSDALCRLATGGGFGTRELYSDDEEKLFDAMRPVMLNGIDDLGTRADLLDRTLNLTLPEIPEDRRRSEDELWAEFDHIRPRVLGALLDAVSAAMRNLPQVQLSSLPRMADFAKWAVAAEQALGRSAGAFMAAYNRNRTEAQAAAIEASPVGLSLLRFMEGRGHWSGTHQNLLGELAPHRRDLNLSLGQHWPKSGKGLSNALRRIAPGLRNAGIRYRPPDPLSREGHNRDRILTLERVAVVPSASSATPALADSDTVDVPSVRTVESGQGMPPPQRPPVSPSKAGKADGADGADVHPPTPSAHPPTPPVPRRPSPPPRPPGTP